MNAEQVYDELYQVLRDAWNGAGLDMDHIVYEGTDGQAPEGEVVWCRVKLEHTGEEIASSGESNLIERQAEYQVEINAPSGAGPTQAYEVGTAIQQAFYGADTEVDKNEVPIGEVGVEGSNYRVDVNVILTYYTST